MFLHSLDFISLISRTNCWLVVVMFHTFHLLPTTKTPCGWTPEIRLFKSSVRCLYWGPRRFYRVFWLSTRTFKVLHCVLRFSTESHKVLHCSSWSYKVLQGATRSQRISHGFLRFSTGSYYVPELYIVPLWSTAFHIKYSVWISLGLFGVPQVFSSSLLRDPEAPGIMWNPN